MLNALDHQTQEEAARFLGAMQEASGGLLANSRIPIGDVLSTFTGISTLVGLGRLDVINTTRALEFVWAAEQPGGGFTAASWDDVADVEYTFYGLGTLALLLSLDSSPEAE